MIYIYTGTPGSGKSLHVARDMYNRLNLNKKFPNVIANFPINEKMIKGKNANFIYKDNSDLTVDFLLDYAYKNHIKGKENQCLVVVDECQVIWNTREWQDKDNKGHRMEWIKFFTQHRHLGYNFIVIAQNDRMIDKQIRSLFEYEVVHRKVNNYKIGKVLPFPTFIAIEYWYGVKEKLNIEFFGFKKKWSRFYDSYGTFQFDDKLGDKFRQCSKGVGGSPEPLPELSLADIISNCKVKVELVGDIPMTIKDLKALGFNPRIEKDILYVK